MELAAELDMDDMLDLLPLDRSSPTAADGRRAHNQKLRSISSGLESFVSGDAAAANPQAEASRDRAVSIAGGSPLRVPLSLAIAICAGDTIFVYVARKGPNKGKLRTMLLFRDLNSTHTKLMLTYIYIYIYIPAGAP
jgi:hypothetical protein